MEFIYPSESGCVDLEHKMIASLPTVELEKYNLKILLMLLVT